MRAVPCLSGHHAKGAAVAARHWGGALQPRGPPCTAEAAQALRRRRARRKLHPREAHQGAPAQSLSSRDTTQIPRCSPLQPARAPPESELPRRAQAEYEEEISGSRFVKPRPVFRQVAWSPPEPASGRCMLARQLPSLSSQHRASVFILVSCPHSVVAQPVQQTPARYVYIYVSC